MALGLDGPIPTTEQSGTKRKADGEPGDAKGSKKAIGSLRGDLVGTFTNASKALWNLKAMFCLTIGLEPKCPMTNSCILHLLDGSLQNEECKISIPYDAK